ncbi:MAG: HAD family phosphatase [Candidatus Micrarchaeota archaeon]|nr:HAD family phosphatase [Candidatus Micrarchaeota archaeon]
MIKCILFDLGGVIIDYTDDRYFYPYLARVSGVPVKKVWHTIQNRMEARLDTGQINLRDFNRAVANRLGIKPSQVKWYEMHRDNSRINRGTMGVVRRLHKRYSVSYLSNVDRSRYEWSTKLLRPYLKFFEHRFASCEIGMRKPSAAIYRYALRHMGFGGREVIFIDNLEENVRGARRAGIKSVLFKSPRQLERALKHIGVRL